MNRKFTLKIHMYYILLLHSVITHSVITAHTLSDYGLCADGSCRDIQRTAPPEKKMSIYAQGIDSQGHLPKQAYGDQLLASLFVGTATTHRATRDKVRFDPA